MYTTSWAQKQGCCLSFVVGFHSYNLPACFQTLTVSINSQRTKSSVFERLKFSFVAHRDVLVSLSAKQFCPQSTKVLQLFQHTLHSRATAHFTVALAYFCSLMSVCPRCSIKPKSVVPLARRTWVLYLYAKRSPNNFQLSWWPSVR